MKKQKVYLETSLFNFYVDEIEKHSPGDTVRLFEDIAAGKYEAFTSAYVIDELKMASEKRRIEMLDLITRYGITVLDENDEAVIMAGIYVEEDVIPKKYKTDGIHIAIAAVNGLDMIVSMNLRHIVKCKTIKMTTHINIMNGYRAVKICSPKEVAGYGKEDPSDRA